VLLDEIPHAETEAELVESLFRLLETRPTEVLQLENLVFAQLADPPERNLVDSHAIKMILDSVCSTHRGLEDLNRLAQVQDHDFDREILGLARRGRNRLANVGHGIR